MGDRPDHQKIEAVPITHEPIKSTEEADTDDNVLAAPAGTPITAGQLMRALALPGAMWMTEAPGSGPISNFWVPTDEADATAARLQDRNVWATVHEHPPVARGRGRAKAATVTRFTCMFADLDVNSPGLKATGLPSFEAAQAVIEELEGVIGPTAFTIASGHGLQPIWLIHADDPDAKFGTPGASERERIKLVLEQWARLVKAVAGEQGGDADSVFDLARVLRVPGTVNWKEAGKPVPVQAWRGEGQPTTVADIEVALADAGFGREVVRPARPAAPAPHARHTPPQIAGDMCGYMGRVVAGWATDTAASRHTWHVGQATRVEVARLNGCLTPAGYTTARTALDDEFRARVGSERPLDAEIERAWQWAAEQAPTSDVAAELGEACAAGHPAAGPVDDRHLTALAGTAPAQSPVGGIGQTQPAAGAAPVAEVVQLHPVPLSHLRDELLSISQLAKLPPTQPLVTGLVYRGTLAQISGGPGSYKSFFTIGMCCALALGESFEGHAVPKAENIIYVAGEGAAGLYARIAAWCELSGHHPDDLEGRLTVLPVAAQLQGGHVQQIIDIAVEAEAALIVIDTRARSTIGLDENSATEMGRAIAAADAIIAATGAAVLLVHHSSRAGSAGRGSNAVDGAVWSDLRMEGSNLSARVHCEKHKDVPAGCDHQYRLVPHTVSPALMPDADVDTRSTLVIVACDKIDPDSGGAWDSDVSQDVVAQAVRVHCPPEGLTATQIIEFIGGKVSRSSVYRSLKALVKAGVLQDSATAGRKGVKRYWPTIESG